VLLSGEPGIGKSRLTAALLERFAAEPHTRLRYFCSPQRTDSALYPIIGQMERAAGFAHDATPQSRLDKLDGLLAQTSTIKQDAALFAELLSLPNDGRYPALELPPQQRRERTLKALTEQLVGLASQHPLLMIFEDVHWIDPTSLEALNRTVDRINTLEMKADAALITGAFGSQPRQKLGLLVGELPRRENALLLQFGQPFDLGVYVDFLGSLSMVGFQLRRGWRPTSFRRVAGSTIH
jgi:predicted ATPase